MKLSLMAVFLMLSCGPSYSRPATPWRVEIATSGGITGRGNGTYGLDSEGNLAIRTMNGQECTFRATDEERARFEELLRNARPDTWNASYAPENRCCDRIEYVLTLEEAGVQRKTEWIDDPLPLPKDLHALAEGLRELRDRYTSQCAATR